MYESLDGLQIGHIHMSRGMGYRLVTDEYHIGHIWVKDGSQGRLDELYESRVALQIGHT